MFPTVAANKPLKILMLSRDVTPAALAQAIGLSLSHVYNLTSGAVATRAGRQKITNFFQQEIWPGIVPVSRTSTPHARGAVEQEQINANPGDHENKNAETEQEAGIIK